MTRILALTAVIGLTGCTSMINKKIAKTYTKTVEAYSAEDMAGAMEGSTDDIVRVLPDGQVLEGREAVQANIQDLFDTNDDIELELVTGAHGPRSLTVLAYGP